MKSKKILSIIGIVLVAVAAFTGLAVLTSGMRYPYTLDDYNYISGENRSLDATALEELANNKGSFAVFVYQPMCEASADFEEVLEEFRNENGMSFYKIAFSDLKETSFKEKIAHYPSFLLFKKGELVEYLDAENDEHTEYFKDKSKFKDWLQQYIKIKHIESSEAASDPDAISEEKELAKNIKLDNVKREANKVNIYFFWGNGCPHCAAEFEALEEVRQQYGDKFALYTFETWDNEDNAALLKTFSKTADGEESKGVPYTVIGKESFTGFSDDKLQKMIQAIVKQAEASQPYDIYFDVIEPKGLINSE